MPLPPDNLMYPVLISLPDGSTGSGFYLNTESATYLATACHVLFRRRLELIQGAITITSLTSDLTSKAVFELDGAELFASHALKKHHHADVAVCKLGTTEDEGEGRRKLTTLPGVAVKLQPPEGEHVMGLPISRARKLKEVVVSNDMFLFGYPTSLGHNAQIDTATPLLRKGVIAGKTEDERIVVDCPVYFGNSGGLVLEIDIGAFGKSRYLGVGIAVEMIPIVEELWSKQFNAQTGIRYENSGYSIVEPMDRILELL